MTKTNKQSAVARLSLAAIMALMMVLGSATAASAQGRALDVEFKDVDVVAQRGGKLTLEYTIKKSSWQELRKSGIKPRLNLFVERDNTRGYNFAYSVELDRRKGRIEYPDVVNVRGTRTVEFEIVGYEGVSRVDRVTYGSECASKIRLAIARKGKKQGRVEDREEDRSRDRVRPGRGARAELVAACERHTNYSSELNKCLDEAAALPLERAALVVDVCGDQTKYPSELYSCVKGASALRHDPVASIQACGAATKFDSELKACVKLAATFDRPAAAVVAACSNQTRYDSGLQGCMKAAKGVGGGRVGALVEACGAASQHDQGLVSCVKTAGGLGRDRVALVGQCGAATRYDTELMSCLVRAGKIEAPRRNRSNRGRVRNASF